MKNPFAIIRPSNNVKRQVVGGIFKHLYSVSKLSRSFKIRSKLVVFFILLSTVPLFILGYSSYNKSSKAIETKIESYSSEIAAQAAQSIKNSMNYVEFNLTEFQNSKDVMAILNNFDQGNATAVDLEAGLYNSLSSKFSYISIEGCIGFALFSKGKINLCNFSSSHLDITGKENKYIELAKKGNGKPIWICEQNGEGSEANTLCLMDFYNQTTGDSLMTIAVFFNNDYLNKMLSRVDIEGSQDLIILDSSQTVISSKDKKKFTAGSKYPNTGISEGITNRIKKLQSAADKKESDSVIKGAFQTSDGGSQVCFSQITGTDWSIVGTITMSYLKADSKAILNTIMLVGFIICLFALIISLFISSSISVPLSNLEVLMKEAKSGNLNISSKDKFRDEISSLSNNFDEMVSNIRSLVSKVSDSSKNVLQSSEKVSGLSSAIHTSAEQVAQSMQQIAIGASEQAEDNLKTLEFVNVLSDDINKVGGEVVTASDVINRTKALSEDALTAVKSLNEKSIRTNNATEDIVNNINMLNDDMKEIQKIIKFIGNISEQINMLSLNAAIEAARAGEAGKGFAVVADNVKKLADQTKESLTTISKVISSIENKSQMAVTSANNAHEIISQQMKAVNQTDNSFKAIFDSLENIRKFMDNFESSVNSILKSGGKTLEAINNISSVSEQTAATVEEVTSTAEDQILGIDEVTQQTQILNELARELNKSISIFRI